jgi:hypothetical protein
MDAIAKIKAILDDAERVAYQRGWDDAVAHIVTAAKQVPSTGVQARLPFHEAKTPQGKPLIDVVKEMIKVSPGLRGTAIVDAILKDNPSRTRKSIDRTTRTALMRLKKRDAIESREGRWYPKEAP